jgi:hypothetical protein
MSVVGGIFKGRRFWWHFYDIINIILYLQLSKNYKAWDYNINTVLKRAHGGLGLQYKYSTKESAWGKTVVFTTKTTIYFRSKLTQRGGNYQHINKGEIIRFSMEKSPVDKGKMKFMILLYSLAMISKSRITFLNKFVFIFKFYHLWFFSAWVGNPDSGTEFIPNSADFRKKIAHTGSTSS